MKAAGLSPLEPYRNALSPWLCRCTNCGREVSPTYNAVQQGKGCRFCAAQANAERSRVPGDVAAAVMREANAEPLVPYPGKNDAIWLSRCLQCGATIRPRYNNVARGRGACRYCAQKAAATTRAMSADEAEHHLREAGAEPTAPYPGKQHLPWPARCITCGKGISPRLSTILQRGDAACAFCSGARVDPDDPVALMRAAGVEPLVRYPGSRARWKSRCLTCGRVVYPSHMSVRAGARGCAYCARVKLDPIEAEQRMIDVGIKPAAPYPGSNQVPWPSTCLRCGAAVAPSLATATDTRGANGCHVCANRIRAEAQRIPEDRAITMMTEAGAEPLEPYPGVLAKWRCRCLTCGHEIQPMLTVIQQGGGTCPKCANYGFDPTSPGARLPHHSPGLERPQDRNRWGWPQRRREPWASPRRSLASRTGSVQYHVVPKRQRCARR
jgi:recombinational DNA repair protein (RecF pathway)